MATSKTTTPAPAEPSLPSSGGSYVRSGEQLQRVAGTEPAKDAVATEPTARGAAPAAGQQE